MKTLKAALKKSSKSDSSFWTRMEQTVKKSPFGDLPPERRRKILDFFTPEWEARDGRFFPRLDDFLDNAWQYADLPSASSILYTEELEGDRLPVNKIANTHGYSFNSVMGLMLTMASLDLVKRVPPYTKATMTPVYHVSINRPLAMFKMAALFGFDENKTEFFANLFKPELESTSDKTVLAIDIIRGASQASHQIGSHRFVKEHLIANANKSFSVVDVLKLMNEGPKDVRVGYGYNEKYKFENKSGLAEAMRLMLEIAYEDSNFVRSTPFLYGEEGRGFIRFTYRKPQVVEIGNLSPEDAKSLLLNLTPNISAPQQQANFMTDEVKSFIQRTVQEAVEAALVHPDRVHMEGIRALLRERKLSTTDPVASIKAKLSKKRTVKA